MNVTVLTSTRADYSIYLPLLNELEKDDYFNLSLVVFGTHTKTSFGHTMDAIVKDGFTISHSVDIDLSSDTPSEVARYLGDVMTNFSSIWSEKSDCDLIICLGDRYEMFAAVSASIPFNIPIAHFHGGETTLGAFDETFRHSLTVMASYHFTSAEQHSQRVAEIKGSLENIHTIGLMSIEKLKDIKLFSVAEFKENWGVDLSKPTILFTFHPETINSGENVSFVKQLESALSELCSDYQILITMPNADTSNQVLRDSFQKLAKNKDSIYAFESLGMKGYFSAMTHCSFLLGNTSSGIAEAASFGKYVINLGDRQKGRTRSKNVYDCPIIDTEIVNKVLEISKLKKFNGVNIFEQKDGIQKVINKLKSI